MRKKRVSLFVFILFSFFIFSNALAQVSLDRGKVKISVEPGKTVSGTLTLRNNSKSDVHLKAYLEDFSYIEPFNGKKSFFPMGSLDKSAGLWINFSPHKLILAPFEKKEVNYVIEVPQNIKGGYTAVLFFENSPKDSAEAEKGFNIVTRMGCLFFLESVDANKEMIIRGVSSGDDVIKIEAENLGDVILISKAIFYIMDEEGLVVDRGETANSYLSLGVKSFIDLPLSKGLSSGTYTMVVTFDLDGGDIMVREVDFSKNSLGIQILEIRE